MNFDNDEVVMRAKMRSEVTRKQSEKFESLLNGMTSRSTSELPKDVHRTFRDLVEVLQMLHQMNVENFLQATKIPKIIEHLPIPMFTPEMKEDPGFRGWWKQVSQVFDSYNMDEAQMIRNLLFYASPETREPWYSTLTRRQQGNLTDILKYFEMFWGASYVPQKELRNRFEELKHVDGMRVADYFYAKVKAWCLAFPESCHRENPEFRQQFIWNLNNSLYNHAIRCNPSMPIWELLLYLCKKEKEQESKSCELRVSVSVSKKMSRSKRQRRTKV